MVTHGSLAHSLPIPPPGPVERDAAVLDPQEDASALAERWGAYLDRLRRQGSGRRWERTKANHASDLGFPCDRHSVLRRTAPGEAAGATRALQSIFSFGHDYERLLRDHLERAGYQFFSEQEPREWVKYAIAGTPEGRISADGGTTKHLIEIKGLHPYFWSRIGSWRDFLGSPIYHRYVAQGQMYLLLVAREERILFILGRKGSYDLKWLWMPLDYDLAEYYVQKAERVNAHVQAGTLPDRITDRRTCAVCDFAGTCLPEQDYGPGAEFVPDPDLQADLDERARLEPAMKAFTGLDRSIKERLHARPLVIVGPWAIEGQWRTRHDPPRDAKTIRYWETRIRSVKPAGGTS